MTVVVTVAVAVAVEEGVGVAGTVGWTILEGGMAVGGVALAGADSVRFMPSRP